MRGNEVLKVIGIGAAVFGAAKLIKETIFSCGTAGNRKYEVHDHDFFNQHGDKDHFVASKVGSVFIGKYDPQEHGEIDEGSWRKEGEQINPGSSSIHKHSPNIGSTGPYEVGNR